MRHNTGRDVLLPLAAAFLLSSCTVADPGEVERSSGPDVSGVPWVLL
jgi:hypothetical protein